jgi:hypothetical protein
MIFSVWVVPHFRYRRIGELSRILGYLPVVGFKFTQHH